MNAWRVTELHIEELVLDGLGSVDYTRVTEAVRRAIATLLAERGLRWLPGESREVAHLDGGTVRIREGFAAAALGRQVGQALFRSISRVERPSGHGGNDVHSGPRATSGRERGRLGP